MEKDSGKNRKKYVNRLGRITLASEREADKQSSRNFLFILGAMGVAGILLMVGMLLVLPTSQADMTSQEPKTKEKNVKIEHAQPGISSARHKSIPSNNYERKINEPVRGGRVYKTKLVNVVFRKPLKGSDFEHPSKKDDNKQIPNNEKHNKKEKKDITGM